MALTLTRAKLKTNFEYVPITEKGTDAPFTIVFDSIGLDTLAELQDAAIRVSKDGEYSISINTLNYAVLKLALVGWKNVNTDDGPIRFKRDNNGATDSSLALIPGDMRNELATIILEVSKDLPNAEDYLATLDELASEDEDTEEDETPAQEETPKPKRKPREKKTD